MILVGRHYIRILKHRTAADAFAAYLLEKRPKVNFEGMSTKPLIKA